jgi:hypothetical protein
MEAAWEASGQAAAGHAAAWAGHAAAWAAGHAAAAAQAAEGAAAAATSGAVAVAWDASPDDKSAEWQKAHNTERAWQIRRFVDVMEAVGQGFDWPDMKVTP